jgi:predicted CoA-binding protein
MTVHAPTTGQTNAASAIDRFLALRHIAIVGVSRDSKQFANVVYRRLRTDDRTVYPVNLLAGGGILEGAPSFHSLADVPDPVEGVLVLVPAEEAADIVQAAIDRGITSVWLHRGIGAGAVSDAAVALSRRHGLQLVAGACPLMFHEPVRGIHRLHRGLAGHRIQRGAERLATSDSSAVRSTDGRPRSEASEPLR